MRGVPLLAVAASMSLWACSRPQSLQLKPGTPVIHAFRGSGDRHQIEEGSSEYDQLQQWLSTNQGGWSSYYSTVPASPQLMTISTSSWSLLVYIGDPTVLLRTEQGVFSKPVAPDEFEFLAH